VGNLKVCSGFLHVGTSDNHDGKICVVLKSPFGHITRDSRGTSAIENASTVVTGSGRVLHG